MGIEVRTMEFCMLFGAQSIVIITKGAFTAQILKSPPIILRIKSPFYQFIHPCG